MPVSTIILDSNLMVLLVVGSASRSYIAKHKRLKVYTEREFDLLLEILSTASRIVVTPNTETETSNLAGYIAEPARTHIYRCLREFLLLSTTDEVYVESGVAAGHGAFMRLGITDAALLNAMAEASTLVTADLDLYLEARRGGRNAVNFNNSIETNRPIG
jgi:hypothetical protein